MPKIKWCSFFLPHSVQCIVKAVADCIKRFNLYCPVGLLTATVSYSASNSSTHTVSNTEIAVVRYAYVTIGAIMLIDSVLFIAAYWLDHCGKSMVSTHQQQEMPLTQHNTQKEANIETSHKEPTQRRCEEK